MRGVLVRSLAVFGIGAAILVGILYYASTVDARPPLVVGISVTQHLSADAAVALTTTSIQVVFSEPVQQATAEAAFTISPATDGAFSWSGTRMTFTPADRLPLRTPFEVQLAAGIRDRAGNGMAAPSTAFRFETVGNPMLVATNPASGDGDVPLDAPIEIDFSTLMDTASVEAALSVIPAIDMELRWAGERLTIAHSKPLDANQRYLVRLTTAARDQTGTPLERSVIFAFDTVREGLGVANLLPADGLEGVAVTTPIAVIFDRALDPGSITTGLLTTIPALPGSLNAVAAPGADGLGSEEARILRFQPSGPLQANTTYEVHLAAGVRAVDGARLAVELRWTFTTGAPASTLSNQVVFLSGRSGVANLWAMNPDGSNQHQLSAELSTITDYAVAPDGRSFVVGDGAILVLQGADGSDRHVLTPSGAIEFDPAFSPDGTTIVCGRADLETGSGLGLWTRAADGGDARMVPLPAVSSSQAPTPTPSPSASAEPVRLPLLRSPRFSPDGDALAFVDESGRLEILDLVSGQLTRTNVAAVTPPVWLADSRSILVSALPAGQHSPRVDHQPRAAVLPFDPAGLPLTDGQLGSLRIARMWRGLSIIRTLALPGGASRPALDTGGRITFVTLDGGDPGAGRLWLATAGGGTSVELMQGDTGSEATTGFTPEPETLLVARGLPSTSGDPLSGVWRVELISGATRQLAGDGWLPRWLP